MYTIQNVMQRLYTIYILGAHVYFHHGLRSEGAFNKYYVFDVYTKEPGLTWPGNVSTLEYKTLIN